MSIFKRKNKKEKSQKSDPQQAGSVQAVSGSSGGRYIISPLLSEKATRMQSEGTYVFSVRQDANKPEIKKEVEKIFKVHVEQIRVINEKPKKRTWRGRMGSRPGKKKAAVTVRAGETIEIVPA
jgi:large subunit ribosomal protein L23